MYVMHECMHMCTYGYMYVCNVCIVISCYVMYLVYVMYVLYVSSACMHVCMNGCMLCHVM